MNARDCSFLLLTGKLGDPERNPLTTAQLRTLTQRMEYLPSEWDGDLTTNHLKAIGLEEALSQKILRLLDDGLQLKAYLAKAEKKGCYPITRTNEDYPLILRKRLSKESPGCLWAKGNRELLKKPSVSLVGSRDVLVQNRRFAREVGRQAAIQGFVLVSGNARGSDSAAQNACLEAGGDVISVVADNLSELHGGDHVLLLSEEDYDAEFSAFRALHRNHIIHALGEIVFVAQTGFHKGGTWDGTTMNLRRKWSPVFCFRDNSPGMSELEDLGAIPIKQSELADFRRLSPAQDSFF